MTLFSCFYYLLIFCTFNLFLVSNVYAGAWLRKKGESYFSCSSDVIKTSAFWENLCQVKNIFHEDFIEDKQMAINDWRYIAEYEPDIIILLPKGNKALHGGYTEANPMFVSMRARARKFRNGTEERMRIQFKRMKELETILDSLLHYSSGRIVSQAFYEYGISDWCTVGTKLINVHYLQKFLLHTNDHISWHSSLRLKVLDCYPYFLSIMPSVYYQCSYKMSHGVTRNNDGKLQKKFPYFRCISHNYGFGAEALLGYTSEKPFSIGPLQVHKRYVDRSVGFFSKKSCPNWGEIRADVTYGFILANDYELTAQVFWSCLYPFRNDGLCTMSTKSSCVTLTKQLDKISMNFSLILEHIDATSFLKDSVLHSILYDRYLQNGKSTLYYNIEEHGVCGKKHEELFCKKNFNLFNLGCSFRISLEF
ncbi:hypothetical protein [Candidatus Sneabacter namystus]|uniref:Uncharacterized protein n=1 Tax=Candidatus Sneabacter namystus TaxID=2601646 RepID=A0A5C0UIU0_9RICK|nr:hypothetical protein [Candidatus Sneabacter namystus]QEK39707.1 hypothetical protein FZC37_02065 [Candidatus Sneabacter namystus]